MTAEELIVEHFDWMLSLEQEGELAQVLASSPEARATYDRYLRVNEVLVDDVVATAPSSALDERVMAAALGAIGGTIGGGSATWISGKIAAAFSVVAIGGLSIFLLLPTEPDPVVKPATPASTNPVPTTMPAPVIPAPDPAVEPADESETTAATPKQGVRTDRTSERPAATTASRNKDRNTGKEGANTSSKPALTLDTGNETKIDHKPQIDPKKK